MSGSYKCKKGAYAILKCNYQIRKQYIERYSLVNIVRK